MHEGTRSLTILDGFVRDCVKGVADNAGPTSAHGRCPAAAGTGTSAW